MAMSDNIAAAFQAVAAQIKNRNPLLVSGTNIKTINGVSILGSGNISISGGGGSGNVIIQPEEPPIGTGEKVLWIQELGNNRFSFWIKIGD